MIHVWKPKHSKPYIYTHYIFNVNIQHSHDDLMHCFVKSFIYPGRQALHSMSH